MGRLYVIMGKSAVGKDSLYCSLIERNPALKTIVPYTTRPIRTGEVEGKEYHFVTESELERMRQQGSIVECRRYYTVHGPWYYFTVDDGQLDFSGDGQYVIISTLEGFEKLPCWTGRSGRWSGKSSSRSPVWQSSAGVLWRMRKIFQKRGCASPEWRSGSRTLFLKRR